MNLLSSKRLKKAKDKDVVFEILDIKKDKKTGFFQKMTEIYTFALAIGIKSKKMEPLIGGNSDPIAIDLFTEEQQKYFDTVVLFYEAGDITKLNKENEENINNYVKVIEEYTNGGLSIIKEKILVHPEDAFNIITRLLNEELKEVIPEDAKGDFEW
jgi:dnd system-associated protein 4